MIANEKGICPLKTFLTLVAQIATWSMRPGVLRPPDFCWNPQFLLTCPMLLSYSKLCVDAF